MRRVAFGVFLRPICLCLNSRDEKDGQIDPTSRAKLTQVERNAICTGSWARVREIDRAVGAVTTRPASPLCGKSPVGDSPEVVIPAFFQRACWYSDPLLFHPTCKNTLELPGRGRRPPPPRDCRTFCEARGGTFGLANVNQFFRTSAVPLIIYLVILSSHILAKFTCGHKAAWHWMAAFGEGA